MKVILKNIPDSYGKLESGQIHDACLNKDKSSCYVCDSANLFFYLYQEQFDVVQEDETVDASYSLETVDSLTAFIDAFNKLNIGEIKFK